MKRKDPVIGRHKNARGKVIRGGEIEHPSEDLRSSRRSVIYPQDCADTIGFRMILREKNETDKSTKK